MEPRIKCGCCGGKLAEDEIDDPYEDRDDFGNGEPICFECHNEHYQFTCSLCEEYDDIAVQHRMVIVRRAGYGVRPGVYQITGYPHYYSDICGDGGVNSCRLRRVCGLTEESGRRMDTYYPLGHICRECQAQFEGSSGYEIWREQAIKTMSRPTCKTTTGFRVWIPRGE